MSLVSRIVGRGLLATLFLLSPIAARTETPAVQDSTQAYTRADSVEVRNVIKKHWDLTFEGKEHPDLECSRLCHKHAMGKINTECGLKELERMGYERVEGDTAYMFIVSAVGWDKYEYDYLNIPRSRLPHGLDNGYRINFEISD